MLTVRQKGLLELLTAQDNFQTVEFFAGKLGVSKRTIHLDLKIIEDYIHSSGEYLEKKRGVGIALRKLKEKWFPTESDNNVDLYSTVTRRMQIMKILLLDESRVSFNHLSKMFIVSKTSIIKDFEFIMRILKVGSNIELKSDIDGTMITGDEVEMQKAYLQFNRYLLSNSDYYEGIISEKIKLLETYYGEKIVRVCSNILYSYVRENVNAISDYYVQNVLNIFIILVYRILNGNHIEEDKKIELSNDTQFFEESAVRLMHKAALRLDFSYTNEDVKYLSQHLIANRFEPFPEESMDDAIINRLLIIVSETLHIDFSNDKKLEEQLKSHIPPMIYRLRSNNKTENPFTAQIKTEFSLTFNVIWVVLGEYEKELGIAFNEDEIAFLTIYFQAAIERAKMNKKILIICQMGIATSELLSSRIKNVIPSLDILEVASVSELEQIDLNQFNLIISTIKIDIPDQNVVFVSPFLTDEDIKKINNAGYKTSKVSRVDTLSKKYHLRQFIRPELIYFDTDFLSREELFERIGEVLVNKNYVLPEFIPSLIERENLGGTDLPSGTAVPHGNPIYVKNTVIVIVKNKKKFKWDKYFTDIVFLICISKKDTLQTRNILSDIYNIVDNSEMLKKIREVPSKKTLLESLGSE